MYLNVLPIVGVHELDAPNPLLFALVGVGHKGACLQGPTVDSDKSQSALNNEHCLQDGTKLHGRLCSLLAKT